VEVEVPRGSVKKRSVEREEEEGRVDSSRR